MDLVLQIGRNMSNNISKNISRLNPSNKNIVNYKGKVWNLWDKTSEVSGFCVIVLMYITKQLIIFHKKNREMRSFIFFNYITEKCGINKIELMSFLDLM